ncbi:cell wall-active antibiotics response protein LiaF [Bacillus sp. 165]|uniref:cell wall-active antibiotics response protein LiaF n=1 Tax=Bacillus sp. 165 TaxID=1529117 RepID=UPI001AD9EE56|nr:cell wall-active antibiotics response protein LiaF [Bacillus sp. 165]MBO9128330.1 cell wall-active antibiotics response protein [Bacillus sp. 165]
MKKQFSKTEMMGFLAVIFGIGIIIDIVTGRFEPMALVFAFVMIMIGRYFRDKGKTVRGNVFIIIGVLVVCISVFSSVAFQLVLVAIIGYVGYQLYISKQQPTMISVKIKESIKEKSIVEEQPFMSNFLVGNHRIIDQIYELQDVNIRYGLGDVQIDFTMAMIPEGETVIVLHGLVGNIRLFIPYDVEVSLNTSVLFGNITMFGHQAGGFNKNIVLKTEQYGEASRRIKIISSLLVGDTEVRYV